MIKKILKEKVRFLKFAIVGLSGTVVNLLLVWLGNNVFFAKCNELLRTGAALALAIGASIFTNFILNYLWTWKDRRVKGLSSFARHLGKYYLASLAAALLQFVIAGIISYILQITLFAGVSAVPVFWKMGASFVGIGIAMLLNFILNHFWTFKQQEKN